MSQCKCPEGFPRKVPLRPYPEDSLSESWNYSVLQHISPCPLYDALWIDREQQENAQLRALVARQRHVINAWKDEDMALAEVLTDEDAADTTGVTAYAELQALRKVADAAEKWGGNAGKKERLLRDPMDGTNLLDTTPIIENLLDALAALDALQASHDAKNE